MGLGTQVVVITGLAIIFVLVYADFSIGRPFKAAPAFKPHGVRSEAPSTNVKKIKLKKVKKVPHTTPPHTTPNTTLPPKKLTTTTPIDTDCDPECQRFRQYLSQWPEDRPKGAIYYLMKMSAFNVHRLTLSLSSLERFVLRRFQYPVIIFHEADFIPVEHRIRSTIQTPVFFQQVQFDVPPFLNRTVPKFIPHCQRSISYRHMCRFQSKLIYEQPITRGLDFLWRLDDDSYILAPLTFDIFNYMEKHHLDYGYWSIGSEIEACVTGLWEAVDEYVNDNGIVSEFYRKWKYPRYYYNNFEVSRRSIWTSPQYRRYINYIDRLGGIYYHRWGDAPIKSLAVALFVPEERTFSFRDMVRYHHSVYNLPTGFPNHDVARH